VSYSLHKDNHHDDNAEGRQLTLPNTTALRVEGMFISNSIV